VVSVQDPMTLYKPQDREVAPMNEVLKRLIFLLFVVVFFSTIISLVPAISFGKEANASQIIVSTKLKDVSQTDIERVRKEAEIALSTIPPILGIEFNKKIKIRIVKKGKCRVDLKNNNILLPKWHVRNKVAPIIELTTFVITLKNPRASGTGNQLYRCGLGVFFQEKYGEDKGFYNYDIPDLSLHDLVRMHRDKLLPLHYMRYKIQRFWDTDFKKLFYIESGSFIRFLYEKYGDQKFKDLYETIIPAEDYKKIYGKNIQELEKEWLNYVFVELPAGEPKDVGSKQNGISKTFIMVQQSENIYEFGKVKFKVKSGDVLEVVRSIGCRSVSEECWIVINTETGMRGMIRKKKAKSLHQVKTEKVFP
jgi:hypothetical protein